MREFQPAPGVDGIAAAKALAYIVNRAEQFHGRYRDDFRAGRLEVEIMYRALAYGAGIAYQDAQTVVTYLDGAGYIKANQELPSHCARISLRISREMFDRIMEVTL